MGGGERMCKKVGERVKRVVGWREDDRMIISREWAMPNKNTFEIKPIRKFIDEEMCEGFPCDLSMKKREELHPPHIHICFSCITTPLVSNTLMVADVI